MGPKKNNNNQKSITQIYFKKKGQVGDNLVSIKNAFSRKRDDESKSNFVFRCFFWILSAVLLLAMPLMSLKSGISGDEAVNYEHAEMVYNYYAHGDTACLNSQHAERPTWLEFYGQSFDNLTYTINHWFDIDDAYQSRHIMNSIIGWFIIFIAGLFCVQLLGWRAGVLALIFMFLSPRFVGHSFNNPKDIPFALGYIMAIYHMFLLCKELPVLKWKRLLYIALGIALANSVRIGGLLLIPYLFMFAGLWYILNNPVKKISTVEYWKPAFKLIFILAGTSLLGYLVGLIYWPYALQAPFKNPIKALDLMTQFATVLRQIFEGKVYTSDVVPSYYLFKYILITIPLFVIIGFALYLIFAKRTIRKISVLSYIIIIFSFAFPILYIMYEKSNVYGGWRHVLFTYPFLVISAVVGCEMLYEMLSSKWAKIVYAVVLLALFALPVKHYIKNHPYEYVYFNELVGGIKGAYGNYEMDYYFNSGREAAEWIIKNAEKNGLETGEKIKVATWHMPPTTYYFRKDTANFDLVFSRWNERGNNDWDYAVFTITGMSPGLIKNKNAFPPKNTVHTIDVDGVPICLILKRTDKSDMQGAEAMRKNDINTAGPLLSKALEADPNNEQAIENLLQIYSAIGDKAHVYELVNRWLQVDKTNTSALYQLANYYYSTGDMNNATMTGLSIAKYNPRDFSGYWIAANAQAAIGNYKAALDYLAKLLEINSGFKGAYQLMAQIYQKLGDTQQAQYVMSIANQLPG